MIINYFLRLSFYSVERLFEASYKTSRIFCFTTQCITNKTFKMSSLKLLFDLSRKIRLEWFFLSKCLLLWFEFHNIIYFFHCDRSNWNPASVPFRYINHGLLLHQLLYIHIQCHIPNITIINVIWDNKKSWWWYILTTLYVPLK